MVVREDGAHHSQPRTFCPTPERHGRQEVHHLSGGDCCARVHDRLDRHVGVDALQQGRARVLRCGAARWDEEERKVPLQHPHPHHQGGGPRRANLACRYCCPGTHDTGGVGLCGGQGARALRVRTEARPRARHAPRRHQVRIRPHCRRHHRDCGRDAHARLEPLLGGLVVPGAHCSGLGTREHRQGIPAPLVQGAMRSIHGGSAARGARRPRHRAQLSLHPAVRGYHW
mmetsp:Transcript_23130/g.59447  ORF Transcript_23130/g.59447 Transcript_23130/m.59447 type:complete len:228 (+) Transcript_23130:244-927(+)